MKENSIFMSWGFICCHHSCLVKSIKMTRYEIVSVIIWLTHWTKSCAVIRYPNRQHGTILPALDHLLCPPRLWWYFPYDKNIIDQTCWLAENWPCKKWAWPISSHLDPMLGYLHLPDHWKMSAFFSCFQWIKWAYDCKLLPSKRYDPF